MSLIVGEYKVIHNTGWLVSGSHAGLCIGKSPFKSFQKPFKHPPNCGINYKSLDRVKNVYLIERDRV